MPLMHAYLAAFIGGLLIGTAAILLWITSGRIMGISGILGGLLTRPQTPENRWRWFFLSGCVFGGMAIFYGAGLPTWFETESQIPVPALIIGGFMVGIGTQLSGGCTSGHGICGLSRLSRRSMLATLIFMATGMVTVTILRNLFGIW